MVVDEIKPSGAGHSSRVAQNEIDNIMSGVSNTGNVKMNNHRKKLRQKFDIIKKLGQGTYGKVQLGINKETAQEVAIKTIKKCKIEAEADLIRIRREVQIMSSVQHPNIIHIYEVFENRDKMILVMEFASGGELYDYLSERKVLTEDEARRIFRQISTAVYYCHKHKICHRDLKLENILLDDNGNAKIADFGLSNLFDNRKCLKTFCGSPLYASPEIVKGTPYEGPEVDCWSLGVLLYTLVYGSMPFDGSNFKRLVKQISQGDYYEPKTPSKASSLIRNMLTVSPQERANIEQICNHWWVNYGYEESCLELAETLANQTPVRLDVLLSLSPSTITADQLVVPSAEALKMNEEKICRSHSAGSLQPEIVNTEAERKILEMVATCGETALMPSPTRTMASVPNSIHVKRKLPSTTSTENVINTKKEKPTNVSRSSFEEDKVEKLEESHLSNENLDKKVKNNGEKPKIGVEYKPPKIMNKHKTADLAAAILKISPENLENEKNNNKPKRKASLPDESSIKFDNEQRSIKMPESVKKFEILNNNSEKNLRKSQSPKGPLKMNENTVEIKPNMSEFINSLDKMRIAKQDNLENVPDPKGSIKKNFSPEYGQRSSDIFNSESSISNVSLKEAKKSMENSIALLNQAKQESSVSLDKSKSYDDEREQKLRNSREVIGNAITLKTKMNSDAFRSQNFDDIKTSKAEITLKSATLPRRKTAKAEIQLKLNTTPIEKPMQYATEMQRNVSDLRSPPLTQSFTKNSITNKYSPRASSAGLLQDSHRFSFPQTLHSYNKNTVMPRYETNSQPSRDFTMNLDENSTSQAIRKSPREFIIPIAIEGGGYITPKNVTSSNMSQNSSIMLNNFSPLVCSKHMRNLENFKPQKSDSQSSGEDEDDDEFEILTAENLFSTLLQRVRGLTNRLNLNNDLTKYQNSRFLNNDKLKNQITWNQEPFSSHLQSSVGTPWKYKLSREFGPQFGANYVRNTTPGNDFQKYRNKFF